MAKKYGKSAQKEANKKLTVVSIMGNNTKIILNKELKF